MRLVALVSIAVAVAVSAFLVACGASKTESPSAASGVMSGSATLKEMLERIAAGLQPPICEKAPCAVADILVFRHVTASSELPWPFKKR